MKKIIKVIPIIMLAIMLLFTGAQQTVLAEDVSGITGAVNGKTSGAQGTMTDIASKVTGFIWVLSIIVAVVVVMYTGLKFIVGSTQEKAEYKKSLIPILVGVLLLVFATTIVNLIFSVNS